MNNVAVIGMRPGVPGILFWRGLLRGVSPAERQKPDPAGMCALSWAPLHRRGPLRQCGPGSGTGYGVPVCVYRSYRIMAALFWPPRFVRLSGSVKHNASTA